MVKSYYTLPPAIEGTLPEWFRYPKNPSRARPLCPRRPSGVKPLPLSQNRQTRHLRPRSSPRRIATDRPLGVATIARKSVGDEVGWLRSWFSREPQGLRLPTEVSTTEGISDSMPAGIYSEGQPLYVAFPDNAKGENYHRLLNAPWIIALTYSPSRPALLRIASITN